MLIASLEEQYEENNLKILIDNIEGRVDKVCIFSIIQFEYFYTVFISSRSAQMMIYPSTKNSKIQLNIVAKCYNLLMWGGK